MSDFKKKLKADGTYHAPGKGGIWGLQEFTDNQVNEWANDPMCIGREACANVLEDRRKTRAAAAAATAKAQAEELHKLEEKRARLLSNPFDVRAEISADARHIAGRIVKNLWIIFVLLPIVLAILYAILAPSHS